MDDKLIPDALTELGKVIDVKLIHPLKQKFISFKLDAPDWKTHLTKLEQPANAVPNVFGLNPDGNTIDFRFAQLLIADEKL